MLNNLLQGIWFFIVWILLFDIFLYPRFYLNFMVVFAWNQDRRLPFNFLGIDDFLDDLLMFIKSECFEIFKIFNFFLHRYSLKRFRIFIDLETWLICNKSRIWFIILRFRKKTFLLIDFLLHLQKLFIILPYSLL